MDEPPPPGAGPGRSRGRARGRAQPPPIDDSISTSMNAMRISPTGSNGNGNGNGSNGNGNGEGAAIRGRGGFRATVPELDTRPENITQFIGTMGNQIRIVSNYIELQYPLNVLINNFEVKFEPEVEAVKMRRQMIYGIQDLFSKAFIFDGMSNIKSIDDDKRERHHVVQNPADPEKNVKITIRFTDDVPWGSLEMLRMFNTQMRRNLQHLGYHLIGRNYFDASSKKAIPEHKIELLMGLLTAIAQHDGGLLVVVDTTTKFIRSETVLELMGQIRSRLGQQWLDEAKRQICGSIVITTYNNRTYKVDDLELTENVETYKFKKGDRNLSMFEYYKEFHGITIRQVKQPLLKCLPSARDRRCGRTDPLYLVPELCKLTGLTEQMKKDFQLMKKVGDLSRHTPEVRVKNLSQFIEKLNANEKVKEEMDKWKLKFNDQLVEIPGRELTCEKIFMGDDDERTAKGFDQKSGDFSREMRSKNMFKPISITKWALIYGQRDEGNARDFSETLKRVCGPMGIVLNNPRTTCLPDDRVGAYLQAIGGLTGTPCQMVVTILANQNKEKYDAIKKICYCEQPLPSQVVVSKTLVKKQMLMSVCTKIAIQMATKLGGEPWALKIPPKDLMVLGYDTYHDTSDTRRSVGGFVSSLNQTLTQWYSRASYHTSKEEMSNNFAQNVLEAVKKYFDQKKTLPLRVIIYRDGVGDGDIQHVFDFELKQVKAALEKIQKEVPIKFAFVIVTKRVNARFFTKDQRGAHNNPIPGTIIDSVVTRLKRYDFYLISQSVRQGTVTPTMYNIIYDSTGFKAEHHQQLAYKLTHLYFNWQGTIRVPAPCQYAHKLAFLTGNSLHREPSSVLADRLFFL